MVQAYTRAYWRALKRSWEDAVSVLALDSLSSPHEIRRLATELGWPEEKVQKALRLAGREDEAALDGSVSTRLFTDLFGAIDRMGRELELSCPRLPLVGTLPSGRVNALAILVPHNADYILAFDSGLWIFADALAELVASTFAGDGTDTVSLLPGPLRGKANRAALETAARVVARYLFAGNPFGDYPLPVPTPHRALKQGVRDALLLFVVGHEYAHITLGHLDQAPLHRCSLDDRVSCTTVAPGSHARELEADRVATVLMMTSMLRTGEIPFWFSGPLAAFFLRATGTLYRRVQEAGGGAFSPESHPPAEQRARAADETARGSLPEEMSSSHEYWAAVLADLGAHFEQATATRVGELVREGRVLAPVWGQVRIE